jgi:hypothetical protein
MTIEQRLVKLLGQKQAAAVWSRIKYWRHEQQFDEVQRIKESLTKNKTGA